MNLKKYKIQDESLDDEEEEEFPNKEEEKIKLNNTSKINQNINKQNVNLNKNSKQNTNNKSPLVKKEIIDTENLTENDIDMSLHSQITKNIINPNNNPNINNDIFVNISNVEMHEDFDEIKSNINTNIITNTPINQIPSTKDFHHVQIIDEDVENFKRRLDIMIKNFRTDTLKDFMGIKRHLLVEQKTVVDSEKQKCDALLAAKTDQVEHLKENLAKTKNAYAKETEIKERLAAQLYKLKSAKYNRSLKIMAFTNGLKKYFMKKNKNKTVSVLFI
jgi:hypothetical protein